MTNPSPQPWEQQPNESDKLYTYFCTHRDLGPARRMDKTAKALDKSVNYLYDLSTRHDWKNRAEAYDIDQDQQWAIEVQTARRSMAKEHAAVADAMMEKIFDRLSTLDLYEMKPADISKWTEVATKVKRLAYGEPDTNMAVTGPNGGPIQLDVTTLTVEERRQRLKDLIKEGLNRTGNHDD